MFVLLDDDPGVLYGLPSAASDVSSGTTADASITLNSDGTFVCQGTTLGVTQSGNWISPTVLATGAYTIRLHVDSGSTPSGSAADTDLALSSNRTWTLSQAVVGTNSATVTLTLKDGGGNTVKSQQATITAQRAI